MSEQLLDAIVDVNDDGVAASLYTCDYVFGDGTEKVQFRNGRAKVPARSAHLLARHPHVTVYGLDSIGQDVDETPVFAPDAAPTAVVVPGDDPEALHLRIAELENQLKRAHAQPGGPTPEGWTDGTAGAKAELSEAEKAERLQAAREHLQAEGVEVPDVEVTDSDQPPSDPPPVPPGFEATTGDGQPRCLAAKGDGSQCANPAVDTGSCGLAKHKEQLTG